MRLKTSQPKFAALCGVAWVMVLGNSMLIPVLPLIRNALHISQLEAGLIITAFSVGAGVTIPIAGFISDHVGRKTVIIPSLALFGLAGAAAGGAGALLARPFPFILAARLVQGVGAGGTYQLAMALTGDLFQSSERTRALGYLESANGVGKSGAPLIGSGLGLLAWYAPFFLYGAAVVPVMAGVWVAVKEPVEKLGGKSLRAYARDALAVMRSLAGPLASAFAGGLMVLFLYFGVLSYLSDILSSRYGVTGIHTGLVITIPVTTMAASALLSGRQLGCSPPVALRWTAIGGLGLASAALGTAAFLTNPYLLVGAITVMSAGNGATLAALNTLVTGSVDRGKRGLVVALYGTVRHIGAATGPPAFGLLLLWGGQSALAAAAILGLAVTAAAIGLLDHRRLVGGG